MSSSDTQYTDMLAPTAATWQRGISLEPATPLADRALNAFLVRGYRELLETSRWLKDTAGVQRAERRLAELGARP